MLRKVTPAKNESWGESNSGEVFGKRLSSSTASTASMSSDRSGGALSMPNMINAVSSWASMGSSGEKDSKQAKNPFELKRNNQTKTTAVPTNHGNLHDKANPFTSLISEDDDMRTGFLQLINPARAAGGCSSFQEAGHSSGGFKWPTREEMMEGKQPVAAHKAKATLSSIDENSTKAPRRRRITVIGMGGGRGKQATGNNAADSGKLTSPHSLPALTRATSSSEALRKRFGSSVPKNPDPFELKRKNAVTSQARTNLHSAAKNHRRCTIIGTSNEATSSLRKCSTTPAFNAVTRQQAGAGGNATWTDTNCMMNEKSRTSRINESIQARRDSIAEASREQILAELKASLEGMDLSLSDLNPSPIRVKC